jgi:N6-L-threonylcarbamoyladenine synthase
MTATILGIESSCDETSAAVVADGRIVLSNVVRTQYELHERFRGVVPEIACRAHAETITAVIDEAVSISNARVPDISAVAVTSTPGLIGSLLVGVAAAKALSSAWNVPLIAVNHVEAHIHSVQLAPEPAPYPHAALVASGGHTALYLASAEGKYEMLGRTTDDAAGEAFDKVAAILSLPYPGGPAVAKAAEAGDPRAVRFPRTLLGEKSLDFSFSGIKTAVLYHVRGQDAASRTAKSGINVADVAASFQEAVADVLVEKLIRAAKAARTKNIALAGGVSANKRLREKLAERAKSVKLSAYWPPMEYTGDNAAMVAGLGYHLFKAGAYADLTLEAVP